jgi:hypothetical protein
LIKKTRIKINKAKATFTGYCCLKIEKSGNKVIPWKHLSQQNYIRIADSVFSSEIQFLLNNLNLLRPIDTKRGVWVDYIKTLLCIITRVTVIKINVTVAQMEIHLVLY